MVESRKLSWIGVYERNWKYKKGNKISCKDIYVGVNIMTQKLKNTEILC